MKYRDIPVPRGLIAFTINHFPTWDNGTFYKVYVMTERDLQLGFERANEARKNGETLFNVGPNNTVQLCMDTIGENVGNSEGEPNKHIVIENFGRIAWGIDQVGDAPEFFQNMRAGGSGSIGLCFDDSQQNIELTLKMDRCTVRADQAEHHTRSLQETYAVVKRYRDRPKDVTMH